MQSAAAPVLQQGQPLGQGLGPGSEAGRAALPAARLCAAPDQEAGGDLRGLGRVELARQLGRFLRDFKGVRMPGPPTLRKAVGGCEVDMHEVRRAAARSSADEPPQAGRQAGGGMWGGPTPVAP